MDSMAWVNPDTYFSGSVYSTILILRGSFGEEKIEQDFLSFTEDWTGCKLCSTANFTKAISQDFFSFALSHGPFVLFSVPFQAI